MLATRRPAPIPVLDRVAARGRARGRDRVPRVGGARAHARSTAWPTCAAERHGAYDATVEGDRVDAQDDPAGPGGVPDAGRAPDADGVPDARGAERDRALPVLAEVPDLAHVLDRVRDADDALLDAVAGVARLLEGDEVERTTGVGIEHWLAAVGALTRMDRRLLVRTARLLHRLPTLRAAVTRRRLSFAQLRGLALGLRTVSRELDAPVDALLAATLDGLARLDRPDPDVLVRRVCDGASELDTDLRERSERTAVRERWLSLQPRLDGTGGTVSGELDAAGLALLDAATAPTAAQADAAGGHGAARADLLLARLARSAPGAPTPDRDPPGGSTQGADRDAPGDDATRSGRAPAPSGADAQPRWDAEPSWVGQLSAPTLLVRLPYAALLDDAVPAELLTRLTGGRLRLTSAAARRLLDVDGAVVRTVVIDDDGEVIGVGRRSRVPPGWLREAVLAVHDTCTGPGCDRPALGADHDHALPWWPDGGDAAPGTTDADNLGPLCASTNRDRHAGGWRVVPGTAGARTWHHPRSGLTVTTVPSTWRAPP